MKDITVLLLAGGDSGRFWPINDKTLVPFLGKPLLYHTLSQFRKFEFKNIVIVVNKQNEQLLYRFKKEFPDLDISYVLQRDLHGQAGAIVSAKRQISGKKILVVNGSDIYEDLLLSTFIKELKLNPDGIITGITQDTYFPGAYLTLSGNKVISIVEKPDPEKRPSNVITMVFYNFKNADSLVSAISKVTSTSDDIFEKALDLLIKEGLNFKFLHYKGFFGYLKYPWHVLNISAYYLDKVTERKDKAVAVDTSAVISGKVYLGEGVKVFENAKIIGPSYIGKGTVIGNNTMIRESMIGERCVVGFGTEIARSYIGNNCWFHTNYLGDSVIGNNVSMGAGSVIANFRLDEGVIKSKAGNEFISTGKVKLGSMIGDNTRIGINASIMPGIKIGSNSVLGPAVLLDKDLPDNKYCYKAESSYLIKDNRDDISNRNRQSQRKVLKFR